MNDSLKANLQDKLDLSRAWWALLTCITPVADDASNLPDAFTYYAYIAHQEAQIPGITNPLKDTTSSECESDDMQPYIQKILKFLADDKAG